MKKNIFSIIAVFFFISSLYSQTKFNTLYTTSVGPGVVHKKVVAPEIPWELDVLEIDLTNPNMGFETVKANNSLKGRQRTSAMADRKNYENHYVVGAINADFFDGNGLPSNSQVIQGEMLKTEWMSGSNPKYWSTIGFDVKNRPSITANRFESHVKANGNVNTIHDVNATRKTNSLVIYNSFYESSTGANEWGTEALIAPLNDWLVNDTLRCVVEAIEQRVGDMEIPVGKAVLSAHGTSETFIAENMNTGDTVKVYLGLHPALPKLKELVGGFPRIVKNGQNYAVEGYREEGGSSNFHTARHPRSAVGFNSDTTKFYFVTVDGRQAHSIGMNLIELADFMVSIGVAQAMNLDGGGSTTMVVRGDVKNSPSDGNERAVANALLAISSAPAGELSHIQIEPDIYSFRMNDQIQFQTSGWDEYYNPAQISADEIEYEVDPSLGSITDSGLFTATSNGGEGWIYTFYNDLVDSAFIHITQIEEITLNPNSATTDTTLEIQFEVNAVDENNSVQDLPLASYEWQSTHPDIGTISDNGLFRGISPGRTQIIVQYAELSDTAEVLVDIVTNTVLLDSMESLQNWNLSGDSIDSLATTISVVDTPRTFGEKSFRIDYEFIRKSTDRAWIYLETDIPVAGVPDTIQLDAKSDGSRHKFYIVVEDDNGEEFRAAMLGYASNKDFEKVNIKTISFRPLDDGNFFYPIRIKGIHIKLGTNAGIGEVNAGSIYIDHLRLQYPRFINIGISNQTVVPKSFVLHQNYPNPFNPNTIICYEIPKSTRVNLSIYNVLGQMIETLVDSYQRAGQYSVIFKTENLNSGVYFYRLKADDIDICKQMSLIK